jgi:predicted methyltransferase
MSKLAKIGRWALYGLIGIAVIAGGVYATRTDPIAMISGRAVTGEVVTDPVDDWSFTNDFQLIAVETRPGAPHSVTTICFVYDGHLYIPASEGTRKNWPYFLVADPRVRLKIGELVYPANATRVFDESLREEMLAAAAEKYEFARDPEEPLPDDIWLFRIESRGIDVAAGSGLEGSAPETDRPATRTSVDLERLAAAVVAADDRSQKDQEMDAKRHPRDLLAFAQVEPGQRVADLGAGGGYTTELLARSVGASGVVFGQNTPYVIEKYVSESWPARLSKDVNARVVRVDSGLGAPFVDTPEAQELDLITMVYVYHDTLYNGVDRPAMNASLLSALKPGGSLVVADHRAIEGAGDEVGETIHRIDEAQLRRELLDAGFALAAEGDFMSNPDDPRVAAFFKMEGPTDTFVHRYVRPR